MSEFTPPGFIREPDRIKKIGSDEFFLIRNRSFGEIDHSFRGLLSGLIDKYIKTRLNSKIQILDVGGGTESNSAKGISRRYSEKVKVVNIDLLAEKIENTDGINPLKADLFNLPFREDTFHLIYSRMVIPNFIDDDKKTKTLLALEEIIRVLKKGGVALIDDENLSNEKNFMDLLKPLTTKYSVRLERKDLGLFLPPADRIDKFLNPMYYPSGKFLVLTKEPIPTGIRKVIDKVSEKLKRWQT